jgi:hypothetical protein
VPTIDSMTTTTKYPKWYDADISPTDVLKSIHIPHICFLSANAYGLKGKLPGGKHTWMSVFNGGFWTTYEVTDMETLTVQGGYPWHGKVDKQSRQIIVSDRDPSQKWFGSEPRLDYIGKYASQSVLTKAMNEYPKNGNFNLLTNNCSTFVSYMAWKLGEDYRAPYVGFKSKKYWEKLLDNQ